jgi:DnaJ-class molecular chaperone
MDIYDFSEWRKLNYDIKENIPCENCNGSGNIKCQECGGNGWKNYYDAVNYNNYMKECKNCRGSGYKECPVCSGYGDTMFSIYNKQKIKDIIKLKNFKENLGAIK